VPRELPVSRHGSLAAAPQPAELATLDAHAHLDPRAPFAQLEACGAVLAMTLSLAEAEAVAQASAGRPANVMTAPGCHPRKAKAQADFDVERLRGLVGACPVVGEVGLDSGSRVPTADQLRTFRAVLGVVAEMPRLVSIHSFRSSGAVLDELRRSPIRVPVLHWWTGTAAETREAVDLGCCFSVHSAVVRRSTWRTLVPPERMLIETDAGWSDPPNAIPHKVAWMEHLLGAQLGRSAAEVRALAWSNFWRIVAETGTADLWPAPFRMSAPAAVR